MKKGFSFKSKKEMIRAIACVTILWFGFVFLWHSAFTVKADNLGSGRGNSEESNNNNTVSYGSWAQENANYQQIYGTGSGTGAQSSIFDGLDRAEIAIDGTTGASDLAETIHKYVNPTQWVSEILGGVFILLGGLINGLLGGRIGSGVWLNLGHVDLTMDSVIFGRLLSNHPVNYVTWELHSGNVYGVLSAFIYRFFWDIAFSAFVLVFFIMLIRQLITGGDSKKRAELKDSLMHGLLIFLLLYLIPQIADVCVYLRDWLLRSVYALMSGSNGGFSYTNIFMAQWASLPWEGGYDNGGDLGGVGGFAMGILFFAASCAGMIFAIDYIRIAIKQTALFAFFPVFAILSLKNKKILSNWLVEFIPNLFIPVIDGVLLLLPCMVIRFANTAGLTGWGGVAGLIPMSNGDGLDLGIFLIVCIMIFSVIPMRKEILKLIGQANPMGGSRGFGGVMAAGMMAMRMMGRGGSGLTSGIESYGGGMSVADNMAMANALENFGSAGASGATAMAASATDNLASAVQTEEAVVEKFGEGADATATGGFGEFREIDANGSPMEEGVADMNAMDMGAEDYDGTSITLSPGEEGYDYTVDAFDARVPEEMDGATADVDTGSFYRDKMFEPGREENLEQLEGYRGLMTKTQEDIDTLSAERDYNKSLLQRYENLGQDIEHAKAGGGLGIVDGNGNPIPATNSNIEAMEKERSDLEKQIQNRVSSYQPKAKQAADGAPLHNADGRERPASAAAERGDLQGQMKEVIKDQDSQIADNRKRYNEQKAGFEQAKRREDAYAAESKAYGSSGERFDSAEAYRRQREVDAVFKQAANYKNFDTRGISEHLDPATRADLYRKRAAKQLEMESRARKQKVLTAAGAGAGAVIGGSAMMFGGEQAAMSGAMMGGMLGGMGAKSASNPANAARKEEMRRRAAAGPNESTHKTQVVAHPKRKALGDQTVVYGKGPVAKTTNLPTQKTIQAKRTAAETQQRAEAAQGRKGPAMQKGEKAMYSPELKKGEQIVSDAMKGKGTKGGKPKP